MPNKKIPGSAGNLATKTAAPPATATARTIMTRALTAFDMPPIVAQAGRDERNFSKKILETNMTLTENPRRLIETIS